MVASTSNAALRSVATPAAKLRSGERVGDVTTHPGLGEAARSMARLFKRATSLVHAALKLPPFQT